MKAFWIVILLFYGVLEAKNILQEAINNAKPGSLLELPAGKYYGNIVIDKPLIIDGKDQKAQIIGDGNGTVIKIRSSFVTLKNLTILNSGSEHEKVDAAISIKKASKVTVKNCKIKNCLFGIDLEQVNQSQIIYNYIESKPFSLGLRGDGIRLWYSLDNNISYNHLNHSRDMVVWYSHGNYITHNKGEWGRYSLHFMYAGKNYVHYNEYDHNSVGIFFMYSQDSIATHNIIKNSLGTTGLGIGLKDCSNFTIKNNLIIYCARGFYIDRSPFQPDQRNLIKDNEILYNSVGVYFHSVSIANDIVGNIFKGNIEDVYDDDQVTLHSVKNHWEGNYWDSYEGFDKNKDGIGDTPHRVYYYADKMWMLNPNVKFFYGSPVIAIMNFLAKIAPLSEPVKLLEDKKPLMKEPKKGVI
jgi:nitrous oxidase accessory protein